MDNESNKYGWLRMFVHITTYLPSIQLVPPINLMLQRKYDYFFLSPLDFDYLYFLFQFSLLLPVIKLAIRKPRKNRVLKWQTQTISRMWNKLVISLYYGNIEQCKYRDNRKGLLKGWKHKFSSFRFKICRTHGWKNCMSHKVNYKDTQQKF